MPEPFDAVRQNISAYNQIAGCYAQKNGAMPEELAHDAARLIDRLSAGPARAEPAVLDVGCGTGRDMAWMESRGVSVAGVDISASMLAIARQLTTGPLTLADMRRLPFAAGHFPAVWSVASLLHLPRGEAPAALREFARVLAPGGLLFLSVQAGEGETLEPDAYGVEGATRFFARYSSSEMTRMIESTGLSVTASGEREGQRKWIWFDARKPAGSRYYLL